MTKKQITELSPDFQIVIDEMELTVTCYLDEAIEVTGGRQLWLPADLIGKDGKTLITYRHVGDKRNSYSASGWFPYHDHMHGGMHTTIHAALAWVQRARDIRAGRADHF